MHAKFVFIVVAVVALALATIGCGPARSPSATQPASPQQYHCPMHPTYIADKPGQCPICGMSLVPIKENKTAPKSGPKTTTPQNKTGEIKPGQFYCPMGAEHVQDTPGRCPKCGMELIEKKETPVDHKGHTMGTQTTPAIPGRIAISLSPQKQQLIGLTFSKIEKRELTRTVRTVALVEHDETRYAKVAPRFAGWVRKLHVNFTGAPVEKDQPLFTVYSPELYAAQNDYLIALQRTRQLKEDASANQTDSAKLLLESARLRLLLFEIDEKEIQELEQHGRASPELLFRAPFSGHVIVKNAVEGEAFAAGESLYEIADLSHLWLRGYVYEFELPLISVGQDAVVNFPYLDNRSFPAKVTFIYPHINPQTRCGEIRLELDNPENELQPNMWANLEIELKTDEKLTVPASAVIDTGQRYVAFVKGQDDQLEPREVRIAAKTDDYYEVVSGLKEGEQVVTRALFLVDSESQLKAAMAGMGVASGHQH